MTDFPTTEEVLVAGEFGCGFRPIVRDPGLLESSLMRPATTVFGADAYPTVWDKAAALLHSLVTTQSLADGNKRTGWAACWLLLGLTGHRLSSNLDVDAAEKFVLDIAGNLLDWRQIAARLPDFADRSSAKAIRANDPPIAEGVDDVVTQIVTDPHRRPGWRGPAGAEGHRG